MAHLGINLLALSANVVSTMVLGLATAKQAGDEAEQSSLLLLVLLGEAGEGALLANELLSEALQLLLLAEAGGQTDFEEL